MHLHHVLEMRIFPSKPAYNFCGGRENVSHHRNLRAARGDVALIDACRIDPVEAGPSSSDKLL
jgi:hypothetical protein